MATNNAINRKAPQLTLDQAAAADSFIQFSINGTGEFRIGADNTDDSFHISQGSALGTNDTYVITSAGEITQPLQPCFLAKLDSTVTNTTGDGTLYNVAFDNEVFDQNGDFDGTSTFTAPISGRYFFSGSILSGDLTDSYTSSRINILSSNIALIGITGGPLSRTPSNQMCNTISGLLDMDAADTCKLQQYWVGSTKTVDAIGDASDRVTFFCGYLVC